MSDPSADTITAVLAAAEATPEIAQACPETPRVIKGYPLLTVPSEDLSLGDDAGGLVYEVESCRCRVRIVTDGTGADCAAAARSFLRTLNETAPLLRLTRWQRASDRYSGRLVAVVFLTLSARDTALDLSA